jgi:hypothetical protein
MEIVSYRTVFDLERRIYRVDRLRLNPGGIPLRGIVYFAAIALITLSVSKLPLVAALAGGVPWYLRELALPAAVAALLTIIRLEGRPFHLAARALIRYALTPRHLAGVRRRSQLSSCWIPGELLVLPDGSDARLRRLRYSGPGAVLVGVAHTRSEYRAGRIRRSARRASVAIDALERNRAPVRGQVIELGHGALLRVGGEARRQGMLRRDSATLSGARPTGSRMRR